MTRPVLISQINHLHVLEINPEKGNWNSELTFHLGPTAFFTTLYTNKTYKTDFPGNHSLPIILHKIMYDTHSTQAKLITCTICQKPINHKSIVLIQIRMLNNGNPLTKPGGYTGLRVIHFTHKRPSYLTEVTPLPLPLPKQRSFVLW